MHPGYKTYAHATLDIVNTFQWKKLALLYDGKNLSYGFYFTKELCSCQVNEIALFFGLFVLFVLFLFFALKFASYRQSLSAYRKDIHALTLCHKWGKIIFSLQFIWLLFFYYLFKYYHFFFPADLLNRAGYFYFISQGSELTVTFVPIREKEEMEDKSKPIATAMNQIEKLELDVILLYTKKENLELFLKQVKLLLLTVNGDTNFETV